MAKISHFTNHMMESPYPRALRVSFLVHMFLILFAGFDIFNLFPPRPIPLPADVQVLTEKEFQQISKEIKQQAIAKTKAKTKAAAKVKAEAEKNKPVAKTPIKETQKTASKAKVTKNQTKISTQNNKKAVKKEKIDLSNLVIQPSNDNVPDDSQLRLIEEDTELLEQLSQQEDILEVSDVEDLDSELSSAELTILREQIYRCWNPPIGAKDYEKLVIRIRVDLDAEGRLQNAKILHRLGANQSDPFYVSAVESVLRAIRHPDCTPLQLPTNKYDIWKRTILTFNPTDILQ